VAPIHAHHSRSNDSYGWHFQYLTIIGLALATLTFIAGAFADITLSQRVFQVKNVLSMCSAPLECLISALYWGLRAIDPKLVVPEELELDFLPGMCPF
jgi:FAR-17a/AIG1-like protein